MPKTKAGWLVLLTMAIVGSLLSLWTVPALALACAMRSFLDRRDAAARAVSAEAMHLAEKRVLAKIMAAKREGVRQALRTKEDRVHIQGLGSVGMEHLMRDLDARFARQRLTSNHSDMLWR